MFARNKAYLGDNLELVNYPRINAGACVRPSRGKQALVDQPECFEHYVTGEYIGTSGCSSSPEHCGMWLKALRGRGGAAYIKPSANIGEEALTDASASRNLLVSALQAGHQHYYKEGEAASSPA